MGWGGDRGRPDRVTAILGTSIAVTVILVTAIAVAAILVTAVAITDLDETFS